MTLKDWYIKKSLDIFSGLVEPYLHHFQNLKPVLLKGNINLALREYICMAVMTIVLVFSVEMPLLAFILAMMPVFDIPMAVMLSLIISLCISGIIAFLFSINPSIKANMRAEKIDRGVPFAATYLTTIAGSGIQPSEMFEILSQFQTYEEMTEEAEKISTRIKLVGMNVNEALALSAKESPSERLSDLLWGIITTIRSGADLHRYLQEKSRKLMKEHKRDLQEYSDSLGTLLQVYLTLIIVGSVFTVIVTSIMSAFGLGAGMTAMITVLQFSIVFLFLPSVTMGFIWLLKSTYPG